jgi:hypothetical protein
MLLHDNAHPHAAARMQEMPQEFGWEVLEHPAYSLHLAPSDFHLFPKLKELTAEWRKLHNEELHSLYSSSDIIRQVKSIRMRWAGHVARMGEERKLYKVLVGNPERKRPLGRPRRRWEDGIRMDLREIGLGSVDWIRLAQDRDLWRAVVSVVMNLRVLAPRT